MDDQVNHIRAARRRSPTYLPWRCNGEPRSRRLSWRVRCTDRIDNAQVVGAAGAIGSRRGAAAEQWGARSERYALTVSTGAERYHGDDKCTLRGSPNRCWGRSGWPPPLAIRRVPVPSDGAFVRKLFESTDDTLATTVFDLCRLLAINVIRPFSTYK